MKCDLNELESVRAFARDFKTKHGTQLDVLVNNGEAYFFGATKTYTGEMLLLPVRWVVFLPVRHSKKSYIFCGIIQHVLCFYPIKSDNLR